MFHYILFIYKKNNVEYRYFVFCDVQYIFVNFDLLEAWDGSKYINVATVLNALAGLPDLIAADETHIVALEDNTDNTNAYKYVAQSRLFLKSDVTPNELYVEQPPPPVRANAIIFNGTD